MRESEGRAGATRKLGQEPEGLVSRQMQAGGSVPRARLSTALPRLRPRKGMTPRPCGHRSKFTDRQGAGAAGACHRPRFRIPPCLVSPRGDTAPGDGATFHPDVFFKDKGHCRCLPPSTHVGSPACQTPAEHSPSRPPAPDSTGALDAPSCRHLLPLPLRVPWGPAVPSPSTVRDSPPCPRA